MASVQTSSYGGRYLKLTVVEESTSIANNTSTVKWTLESIGGSASYYTIYNCKVVVNGQTVYNPGTVAWDSYNFPAKTGSKSGTITVNHNADGTASPIGFELHGKVFYSGDENKTGTLSLSTIPRYTSITSFSVAKRNETSVKFSFTTADACDYAWYSKDNGSSWSALPSNNIVTGLSPNTTYNFKLRVRRTDSQLTTDSGTVSQTTYKVPSQSLSSKTETSITMNWSCDSTVDYIWYSKDNGSTWTAVGSVNATSGNYTISGLSANTSYNIKTRVRRKDPQTTYDTTVSSQTTYAYPYCTEAPNFTIGNNVTIKLYNPLNRTVQIQMWSHVSRQFVSELITINGTSYTGFSDVASRLYASIPNDTSSKYNIDVWYGNNKAIKEGGNYSIIGTETPTFNNFSYRDSNSVVSGVTGNDQVMVKGLSRVEATILSANKMVAQNSATPNNYITTIDNLSNNTNYSDNDLIIDVGTILNSGTKRLNITAYDSRGLFKTIYKDITVYDYSKPVVNATITRLNNFEAQTTIKVSGTYTKLAINNVNKNDITRVQYRYRETGGTWSSWINLTTTTNNGNFTCSDVILSLDNTKSFEFEIQATDTLQQVTTLPVNLDIGQAIFFISSNNRTCYINGNEVLTNNYTGNTSQTGNATITGTVNVIGTLQNNGQDVIMYDVVDTW